MISVQCVVCGQVLAKTPHREGTTAQDHRDQAHPDVKKSIPLVDLFRIHDEEEATP